MAGYNISREVAVLPFRDELNPDYLALAVAAVWSQNWLSGATRGVAYTGVNIRDLKKLQLPIPPLDEQAEIVTRVHEMLKTADEIDQSIAHCGSSCDHLPNSVFDSAFRGELLETEAEIARAEGRDFESGTDLLSRFRTQVLRASTR